MNSTGILRKVDHLGRIVLPKELRDDRNINSGDSIEIFTNGGQIVLQKYTPGCIVCGSLEVTEMLQGKKFCSSCIATLAGKVKSDV